MNTEERIRDALHSAAAAITVEPATPDLDRGGPTRRARVGWSLAAAAAVAGLAVAVAVVGGSGRVRPAHTGATRSSSSPATTSSPPPVVDTLHALRCTARNGDAWWAALHEVVAPNPPTPRTGDLDLLGVDGNGSAVAMERSTPQKLVLVGADGSARTLYTPGGTLAGMLFGDGDVEGEWAVFELDAPGGLGSATIALANTRTREIRLVRQTRRLLGRPWLMHGRVYWSESTVGHRRIHIYDIKTRARTLFPTDALLQAAPNSNRSGNLFASAHFVHGRSEILVQRDGDPPVQVYRAPSGSTPKVFALTGPQVVWSDGDGLHVLDLRTGAATSHASSPRRRPAASHGGTLALNIGPTGSYDLSIAKIADLPELRC